jgi:hypothetical protein
MYPRRNKSIRPISLTRLPFAAVLWWKALLLLDTADGYNKCVRLGLLNQERPRRSLHDLEIFSSWTRTVKGGIHE